MAFFLDCKSVTDTGSDDDSSLSTGAIIGIAIGSVGAVVVLVIVTVCVLKKVRKP